MWWDTLLFFFALRRARERGLWTQVVLQRAVLTDFEASPQYKTWLALKFPVDSDEQDRPASPSILRPHGGDSTRRPSLDFDLPELRSSRSGPIRGCRTR